MRAGVVFLGVLVCLAAAGLGPAVARSDDERARAAAEKARAGVDLSGRWAFNKADSDDAREKMREVTERGGGGLGGSGMGGPGAGMGGPGMGGGMPGMGGGGGRGGRMGPPPGGESEDDDRRAAMRALFQPAAEIEIFQGQPEIVVAEKAGRRRILHADGRKYKAEGGSSEVKTAWKDGRLVVESQGFGGRKTTETWVLSDGGQRLTSTVKIEGGYSPGVTLKRVYDRAAGTGPAANPDGPQTTPPPPQP